MRLYFGGIPSTTTADSLKKRLDSIGVQTSRVSIIPDKIQGDKCRGFAYVTVEDENQASLCIKTFHGTRWAGKILQIEPAKEDYLAKLKREQEEQKQENQQEIYTLATAKMLEDIRTEAHKPTNVAKPLGKRRLQKDSFSSRKRLKKPSLLHHSKDTSSKTKSFRSVLTTPQPKRGSVLTSNLPPQQKANISTKTVPRSTQFKEDAGSGSDSDTFDLYATFGGTISQTSFLSQEDTFLKPKTAPPVSPPPKPAPPKPVRAKSKSTSYTPKPQNSAETESPKNSNMNTLKVPYESPSRSPKLKPQKLKPAESLPKKARQSKRKRSSDELAGNEFFFLDYDSLPAPPKTIRKIPDKEISLEKSTKPPNHSESQKSKHIQHLTEILPNLEEQNKPKFENPSEPSKSPRRQVQPQHSIESRKRSNTTRLAALKKKLEPSGHKSINMGISLNKKIKFGEDGSQTVVSNQETSIQQTPLNLNQSSDPGESKKIADWLSDSDSDSDIGSNNNKLQSNDLQIGNRSSDASPPTDANDFAVREVFEGKEGQKMFKMQQSYRNDPRFRLTTKFRDDFDEKSLVSKTDKIAIPPEAQLDSDGSSDEENKELGSDERVVLVEDYEQEKRKGLSVLSSIIGEDLSFGVKKMEFHTERYDPSCPSSVEAHEKTHSGTEHVSSSGGAGAGAGAEADEAISGDESDASDVGDANLNLGSLFGSKDTFKLLGSSTTAEGTDQKEEVKNNKASGEMSRMLDDSQNSSNQEDSDDEPNVPNVFAEKRQRSVEIPKKPKDNSRMLQCFFMRTEPLEVLEKRLRERRPMLIKDYKNLRKDAKKKKKNK